MNVHRPSNSPRLFRTCHLMMWAALVSSASAQDNPTRHDWPMFRGDSQLTGVAVSSFPGKPKVRWSYAVTDAGFTSAAAVVGDIVFVGDDMGTMHAVDFDTGKKRWTRSVGDSISIGSSPTVAGDLVLFGDDAGIMHALNAKDGTTRWTFKTEGPIISSVNLAGDRMVFGSYDGNVYCLDRTSGKLLWKCQTEDKLHGTPGIIENRVLIAGCDSKLHVIDLTDGTERASVEFGSVSGSSAAIKGSRVFFGTYGNRVLCVDWKERRIVWQFENKERQFPFVASAALSNKLAIIGGRDKSIHALDLTTGKRVWSFAAKGRVEASAVIAGDIAIVGTQKGVLFAINVSNGQEAWRFEAGDSITASVAIARNRIVIGTDDGVLYCLDSKPTGK